MRDLTFYRTWLLAPLAVPLVVVVPGLLTPSPVNRREQDGEADHPHAVARLLEPDPLIDERSDEMAQFCRKQSAPASVTCCTTNWPRYSSTGGTGNWTTPAADR